MIKFIIIILVIFTQTFVFAGESFIPLQKGVRIASDDLIFEDTVLTSREAQDMSNLGQVDLSVLVPKSNEIWSSGKSHLNDQEVIELAESETLTFEGSLNSNSGLYRFNAIALNGSKIYTIHFDKTLHTLLLRKNILRMLGYKIPAIKYLKKAFIQFRTVEEREQFLKKDIPENTLGAPERWVKSVDELTVEVQDFAVTEPSENDFYNVAMGIPTQTINSRTLRSLVIPYSILDLNESVNQYSWVSGKVDNRAVILSHFTGNEFSTTIEDAQWMIRRFNLLTRNEIKQAVAHSYFPEEVGAVLVEKIISRRNSMNRLFSEKSKKLEYDQKITMGETLKEGKILQKEFEGYASRFSYGDAESPFEQLRFYLYSKIQSNVIDNLITKFNTYLVGYDLGKTRSEFFQKQFEDGLQHFIQTGEIRPIGIETWTSPFANASLIFSRDIVLGNYLGTDNLVQLADTFGASLDLGLHVGVEGLGNNLAGSIRASTSMVRTFSHIKPVKNLKQSLKEPYRNMFVNLLKKSLKERYLSLAELKDSAEGKDEKAKKVQALLKEIDQYLNTGESLIMTDRLMPSVSVKLNFTTGLIGAGTGVGAGVTTIKRIHVFKKSPKVLQIYDDSGFVKDINLSYEISEYISILKLAGSLSKGNYKIKSYMINLSSDLEENPNLYLNSLAVYNVLKNKNFEVLNKQVDPVNLDANFRDRGFNFSLLFWKMKSLKGKTYYDLSAKDGINGRYFSLNKDFMSGINAESFSKQIANYYLAEPSKGNVSLREDDGVNPGDSFFGRSYSQAIRFEASINSEGRFENKFLSLSDTKQGWGLTPKKLKKMMTKVNEKFQASLFDVAQIDFEKLRLFRVGYHLNLYDRGIQRLNNISAEEINEIETRYRNESRCSVNDENIDSTACGDLSELKWSVKRCRNSKNDEQRANCNVELIDDLLTYLKFNDFKKIIGENNLYVYGTMDGFRQNSEILNDTIYSNTVGKIGSKQWNGPLEVVRDLLGLSGGEFSGSWLRDSI